MFALCQLHLTPYTSDSVFPSAVEGTNHRTLRLDLSSVIPKNPVHDLIPVFSYCVEITCLHIYLSKLIVCSFRDKTVCPSSCASLPLWDSSVPDVQYKCSVNFCWMNERMRNHSEITERMGPNVSELVFNLVT